MPRPSTAPPLPRAPWLTRPRCCVRLRRPRVAQVCVRRCEFSHSYECWCYPLIICAGVIEGADRFDSTAVPHLAPTPLPPVLPVSSSSTSAGADDTRAAIAEAQPLRGLVVGLPREYHVQELSTDMMRTWQQGIAWLQAAGAKVNGVTLNVIIVGCWTAYVCVLQLFAWERVYVFDASWTRGCTIFSCCGLLSVCVI
jgi:hypothetical protein